LFRERERERVKRLRHIYYDITNLENLLNSWQEFLCGKRKRHDVAEFALNFMDNILELHHELVDKTYCHGGYQAFKITDPKVRDIHKASVKDRLLHHAIYRILYPFFDKKFIFDSYSCRIDKGTHRAINRFRQFANIVSKNNHRTCWILKCDIRKFFANIDHDILLQILAKRIGDKDVLWLLGQIITSFHSEDKPKVGLPLGNLTSQLFINIYMNEFDQFVKRKLKVKYYIRYADDFMIIADSADYLKSLIPRVRDYLLRELKLELHPDKLFIKTLAGGVDFLGWIHFFDHRILRKSTKNRALRKISKNLNNETYQSYLGLLEHGNARKIERILDKIYNN